VKVLLDLKKQYKSVTGQEWKPGQAAPVTTATSTPAAGGADDINNKIQKQGDLVRDLKAKKVPNVSKKSCTVI